MLAKAKRTSVPQIFINDAHIGGYDDLMALHRKGGLEPPFLFLSNKILEFGQVLD